MLNPNNFLKSKRASFFKISLTGQEINWGKKKKNSRNLLLAPGSVIKQHKQNFPKQYLLITWVISSSGEAISSFSSTHLGCSTFPTAMSKILICVVLHKFRSLLPSPFKQFPFFQRTVHRSERWVGIRTLPERLVSLSVF